jgi:FdhD protein
MLRVVDHGQRPDVSRIPVVKIDANGATQTLDTIAVEEPLELRLAWGEAGERHEEPVSITMRTPGSDLELAIGFLLGEGILHGRGDVLRASHVGAPVGSHGTSNTVLIEVAHDASHDVARLARHFYATSSCGVCGKASMDLLRLAAPPLPALAIPALSRDVLHGLPTTLRHSQPAFEETGGLHAAALFDETGKLLVLREDVGRHNAVDKVVGAMSMNDAWPATRSILLVSGRASFELVQKALMAGVPILAAVGAPSSLAVDLAREVGMTLVGFLRDARFNIYSGRERIVTRE